MRSNNPFDERHDSRAMEDIKLCGIFLEDLREVEHLDGPPPVVGRIESNMGRRGTFGRLLDREESLGIKLAGRRRPQAKEHLEQVCLGLLLAWIYAGHCT